MRKLQRTELESRWCGMAWRSGPRHKLACLGLMDCKGESADVCTLTAFILDRAGRSAVRAKIRTKKKPLRRLVFSLRWKNP